MDPSALIFVALAVAWAVYLIPKALHTSDEGSTAGGRLSAGVRVLARRGPAADSTADTAADADAGSPADRSLAKAEARAARRTARKAARQERRDARKQARRQRRELRRADAVQAWLAASPAARRHVARLAARRRRRVLGLTVLATVAVAGVAAYGRIETYWVAVPAALTVAWLVVCRVMVRREQSVRAAARPSVPAEASTATEPAPADPEATGEFAAYVEGAEVTYDETGTLTGRYDPVTGSWDPVPVHLPTYVNKAAAPRSVRTIDLDATGVWSSGRSEADSALAREAEATASAEAADAEHAARVAHS